jgi:hypothetical protein
MPYHPMRNSRMVNDKDGILSHRLFMKQYLPMMLNIIEHKDVATSRYNIIDIPLTSLFSVSA